MRTVRYILPTVYRSKLFNNLHTETIIGDYPIILPEQTYFYHPYGGLYKVQRIIIDSMIIECELDRPLSYFIKEKLSIFSIPPEVLISMNSFGKLYVTQDKTKEINWFRLPILMPIGCEFYSSSGLSQVSDYKAYMLNENVEKDYYEKVNWKPEFGIENLQPICNIIKSREELYLENPNNPLIKIDDGYFGGVLSDNDLLFPKDRTSYKS